VFTVHLQKRRILASACYTQFLLFPVELSVSLSVSYTPPPGVVLGPNEYRAASGPVVVTCTVIGGTGPTSYQWSSNCRSCPFETANSSMIRRGAVHSGDTGTHTCTATSSEINGSASIFFIVKGEHSFIKVKFSNNIAV